MFAISVFNANGQTNMDVPTKKGNNRFSFSEFMSIKRPGLSLNGFDSDVGSGYGLGLKQVLELAYFGNSYYQNKINDIIDDPVDLNINKSIGSISDNDTRNNEIERNSRIIQYTAFEALASYVLEHNNMSISGVNIRSHDVAMAELKDQLLYISNSGYFISERDDYVKNVRSVRNKSRAIDLYLAIENAYEEWDHNEWADENSDVLLSYIEREKLNHEFYVNVTSKMRFLLHSTGSFLASLFDVQEYEVEPGNRPLKGFLSVGYSTLVLQDIDFNELGDGDSDQAKRDYDSRYTPGHFIYSWLVDNEPKDLFQAVKNKASLPSADNRVHYWNFQSNGGSRQWAEGPFYFK